MRGAELGPGVFRGGRVRMFADLDSTKHLHVLRGGEWFFVPRDRVVFTRRRKQ